MSKEMNKLTEQFHRLIFESVKSYAAESPQANLDSEAAQSSLALFIISYLSTFINDCDDEISSLQFMLDEFHNAQASMNSPEFKQELNDSISLQLARLKMMQNNKGDA